MLQHDCVPVFRTAVLSLLKTGNDEFRPPSARSEIAEPTGRKHVCYCIYVRDRMRRTDPSVNLSAGPVGSATAEEMSGLYDF